MKTPPSATCRRRSRWREEMEEEKRKMTAPPFLTIPIVIIYIQFFICSLEWETWPQKWPLANAGTLVVRQIYCLWREKLQRISMNSKMDFEENKRRLFSPVDNFTKNEIYIGFWEGGDFLGWVIFIKVNECQHVSDTALNKKLTKLIMEIF